MVFLSYNVPTSKDVKQRSGGLQPFCKRDAEVKSSVTKSKHQTPGLFLFIN